MSKICQEKFELRLPIPADDDGNEWVSDKTARTRKGTPGGSAVFYGSLPPGSDIQGQEESDQHVMPFSMGGETDVSQDWNPTAVREGWSPRKMRPTDDLWTGEHCDAFYGDMTVDGVTGFLERNNMLDRQ